MKKILKNDINKKLFFITFFFSFIIKSFFLMTVFQMNMDDKILNYSRIQVFQIL